MTSTVTAYTDGCCLGNPGAGGWGALICKSDGSETEIFGGTAQTTNNRMELQAVIEVLKGLPESATVQIYTDSKYVQQGLTTWLAGWKRNGWRTSSKGVVKNQDLWQELDQLCSFHKVTLTWVRGHNGHPENERADALANKGATPYA